jgi:tellurite resistance protein
VCELIAGIIATDGELHASENLFLGKLFGKLGLLGGGELVIAPTTSTVEAARAMSELSPEVQQEALALLIDAAVADGKVVPDERRYLEAVGEAAGLSKDELDTRIAERLAKP